MKKSSEIAAQRSLTLLTFIESMAAAGKPAPSNAELMAALDASIHCILDSINRLELKKMMSVQYKSKSARRFIITESGLSTDWTDLKSRSRPQNHEKSVAQKRPCITGCGTMIMSDGPHHRMCPACRNSPASHETAYRIAR